MYYPADKLLASYLSTNDSIRVTSIWWLWLRPFLTLQYPAVIWGSLTYGVSLGWVVFQQTANAIAFPELYGFGRLATGNINIAVRTYIFYYVVDHSNICVEPYWGHSRLYNWRTL